MDRAGKAAGSRNVSVAGGASTVKQYLSAGLIDELRLHVAPRLLGAGERLFEGGRDLNLEMLSVRGNALVTHQTYHIVR